MEEKNKKLTPKELAEKRKIWEEANDTLNNVIIPEIKRISKEIEEIYAKHGINDMIMPGVKHLNADKAEEVDKLKLELNALEEAKEEFDFFLVQKESWDLSDKKLFDSFTNEEKEEYYKEYKKQKKESPKNEKKSSKKKNRYGMSKEEQQKIAETFEKGPEDIKIGSDISKILGENENVETPKTEETFVPYERPSLKNIMADSNAELKKVLSVPSPQLQQLEAQTVAPKEQTATAKQETVAKEPTISEKKTPEVVAEPKKPEAKSPLMAAVPGLEKFKELGKQLAPVGMTVLEKLEEGKAAQDEVVRRTSQEIKNQKDEIQQIAKNYDAMNPEKQKDFLKSAADVRDKSIKDNQWSTTDEAFYKALVNYLLTSKNIRQNEDANIRASAESEIISNIAEPIQEVIQKEIIAEAKEIRKQQEQQVVAMPPEALTKQEQQVGTTAEPLFKQQMQQAAETENVQAKKEEEKTSYDSSKVEKYIQNIASETDKQISDKVEAKLGKEASGLSRDIEIEKAQFERQIAQQYLKEKDPKKKKELEGIFVGKVEGISAKDHAKEIMKYAGVGEEITSAQKPEVASKTPEDLIKTIPSGQSSVTAQPPQVPEPKISTSPIPSEVKATDLAASTKRSGMELDAIRESVVEDKMTTQQSQPIVVPVPIPTGGRMPPPTGGGSGTPSDSFIPMIVVNDEDIIRMNSFESFKLRMI